MISLPPNTQNEEFYHFWMENDPFLLLNQLRPLGGSPEPVNFNEAVLVEKQLNSIKIKP